MNVLGYPEWWVESGESVQNNGSVGIVVNGKEREGSRLGRDEVGARGDGESCVGEQLGGGLVHAGGFALQVRDGKVLTCNDEGSMKGNWRKWSIIVEVGAVWAMGVVMGDARHGRVLSRRVGVRFRHRRLGALKKGTTHVVCVGISMRRLPRVVGVQEHNVHGGEWVRSY